MKPNSQKFGLLLGFGVSAIAITVVLTLVSFDDRKTALLRLDESLSTDSHFKETIGQNCHSLVGRQTSTDEKFILNRFAPPPGAEATQNCFVSIQAASRSRFGLEGHWNFGIELETDQGRRLFHQNYTIQFPRPRTLLPVALLFLAVVFEIPFWGWFSSFAVFLLLISGANPLHLSTLVQKTLPVTLQTEGTLAGLLLLCGWVAIASNRHPKVRVLNPTILRNVNQGKSILGLLLGLWNPIAFTLCAPLTLVFRGASHRLSFFFDAQILITALSLYLLSFDYRELAANLGENLMLPRYLTLALFLFLLLPHKSTLKPSNRLPIAPHSLLRAMICILLLEAASQLQLLPFQSPTLTRMAAGLFLSEILWPYGVHWKRAYRSAFLWTGTTLLVFWLGILLVDIGMPQMVFGLIDPRMHPTAMVFFTFTGSLVLATLTGSFTASYFPILMLLANHHGEPLVRAALIEGILAGMFLSPFSLLNLLPAVQFRLNMKELLSLRLQQLGFPLLISTTIYALSAMSSIAILRPVTFIFLCLLGLFIQLKKQQWRVGDLISGKMPAAP
jgi:hypothetical protein